MSNAAFERGKQLHSWWPDWLGECAVIVASGDSTKKSKVEQTQDRIHVLAVKKNIELLPWAEVCYGCDEAWWKMNDGLPKYRGLKMAHGPTLFARYPEMKRVTIKDQDKMLTEEPMTVGSGGNSGFQALNLAVQFGATSIALVGFDMKGEHWYGRNKPPMNNPAESNFKRWLRGFEAAVPGLKKLGVEVVNCSLESRITCFPKMTLTDTLREWGL